MGLTKTLAANISGTEVGERRLSLHGSACGLSHLACTFSVWRPVAWDGSLLAFTGDGSRQSPELHPTGRPFRTSGHPCAAEARRRGNTMVFGAESHKRSRLASRAEYKRKLQRESEHGTSRRSYCVRIFGKLLNFSPIIYLTTPHLYVASL